MIPAAIAGLASVAAAGVAAGANYFTNKATNEARKREAELAYQRQKEQIKMQNAYNSPSAQMARYAAAGLNPNLIYDSGETGNQAAIPEYHAPEVTAPDLSPAASAGSTFVNSMVGIKDMENKTLVAESQVRLNSTLEDVNLQDVQYKKDQSTVMLTMLGFNVENIQASTGKILEETELTKEQKSYTAKLREKVSQEISNLQAEYRLTEEEIKNLSARTKATLTLLPGQKAMLEMSVLERQKVIERVTEEIALLEKDNLWYGAEHGAKLEQTEAQTSAIKTSEQVSVAEAKLHARELGTRQAFGAAQLTLEVANTALKFCAPTQTPAQFYGANPWTQSTSNFGYGY